MRFGDIVKQLNETKETTAIVHICKNRKCRNNDDENCTRAFIIIGADGTCGNIK